jgi:hypothetical protein
MLHDKNLNKIKQPLILIICKLDIFHLMCAADKIWITELILIHKYIMCKFIGQSNVKHIMTSPIKTIRSVLKALTDIITNIPARPIELHQFHFCSKSFIDNILCNNLKILLYKFFDMITYIKRKTVCLKYFI